MRFKSRLIEFFSFFVDMNYIYCCIALAICVQYSVATKVIESEQTNTTGDYRLPTNVHPEHYKVKILTHLGDENGFIFKGKVWIKVSVSSYRFVQIMIHYV